VNRLELRQLSEARIVEAKVLLDSGQYPGAYYLAGYAVECGLKACIIVQLKQSDDFPEKRFSEKCYTHNLENLLGFAGLAAERDADAELQANWAVVKDWSEESRYQMSGDAKAREIYSAITDVDHGVLPWIKLHW